MARGRHRRARLTLSYRLKPVALLASALLRLGQFSFRGMVSFSAACFRISTHSQIRGRFSAFISIALAASHLSFISIPRMLALFVSRQLNFFLIRAMESFNSQFYRRLLFSRQFRGFSSSIRRNMKPLLKYAIISLRLGMI